MNTNKEINPFDILSGKIHINKAGSIFYFNRAGNNVDEDNLPIWKNVYKIIFTNGYTLHYKNGEMFYSSINT